jgi:hypothetical protein
LLGAADVESLAVTDAFSRLRGLLAEQDIEPTELGMFHSTDPQLVSDVAALMMGAAAGISGSTATGTAVGRSLDVLGPSPKDRRRLPPWVAVVVTADEVCLFATDREGDLGRLVARLPRGTFRAHTSHYLHELDLTLESEREGRMVLKGKAGPLHPETKRVAAAACGLSVNAASPKDDAQR